VRQACEEKVAQEEAKVQQACAEVQGLRAQVVQYAKLGNLCVRCREKCSWQM